MLEEKLKEKCKEVVAEGTQILDKSLYIKVEEEAVYLASEDCLSCNRIIPAIKSLEGTLAPLSVFYGKEVYLIDYGGHGPAESFKKTLDGWGEIVKKAVIETPLEELGPVGCMEEVVIAALIIKYVLGAKEVTYLGDKEEAKV